MSSPAPTSPPSPPSNSASPLPAPVDASPPAPAVASPPAPAVASPPPAPATASSPPAPPPATNPPPVAKSPSPSSSPPPPSTPAPATSPPPPRNSSTPVTPSPPPPSGSKSPSTPAVTPSSPSGTTPSTPGIPPPPTSTSPSTPSSSNNGGTNGISTGMIAGIAIAGVAAILLLVVLLMCCKKKKRRQNAPAEYYGPPPSHQKVEPYGGPAYHWQQSAPPQIDHVVTIPPKVPLPPGGGGGARPPHSPASHPPPPPALPAHVSSGGSGSNYSGSETPAIPPAPGMVFAFSQSTFTYEELSIATDGFSEANLLGQGGFGYVHKGILPNGKEVAIKQLKAGSGQGEREFQAEVEIISRVHHKHLVSLVGYCMAGAQRMLVYEFVPNDTLEFHLHGTGRPPLDWSMRLRIALGAAKGLAYLHEDCHPKIIHRDIKASNILLDFNFEAKVADFGLAKLSSDANTHISTRVMGTFGYLAPEYASSGKLTDRSDVFSFGVVLLELLTGRRPVDTKQSYMDDSLVDWARPLLTRALEEGNFDGLLDEKLQNDYMQTEVSRMVACAAASVRHSARRRPKMSQIVRALEGQVSLSDLNEGIMPGHSTVYSSYGSSDYDTAQYKEDMIKFRNLALASKDYTSSEYSAPTSEYGLNPSGSSSEAQTTSEMEMSGKMKKDSKGFNGGSS